MQITSSPVQTNVNFAANGTPSDGYMWVSQTSDGTGWVQMDFQETYKISLPLEKDGTGILQKIDIILENVRNSDVYQRARGVYVKLLMAQVPLKEGEEIDKLVREGLPKAAVAGMTSGAPTKELAGDVNFSLVWDEYVGFITVAEIYREILLAIILSGMIIFF